MVWGRKKRYAIAASVAALAISVAVYYAAEMNPYKNHRQWTFDSYRENIIPDGFVPMRTSGDEEQRWFVKSDSLAASKPNVLAQLSSNDSVLTYPMLIISDAVVSHFKTSVKFMIVSGEKAQAAGLVFRFQDKDHYFVLVADALNDRFSVCRAEPGKLICTQGVDREIETGRWYTMTAHVAPQGVGGYFDDQLLIRWVDKHYITGGIGLWAKMDSGVYFDDLTISY